MNPALYRLVSASCGGLSTIPLDVLQTKILTDETVEFKLEEFKWLVFMPTIFVIQNGIYTWSDFMSNKLLRSTLAGLSATPPYIFLEIKKLYTRLDILPKYKPYIFWMTIREIVVYVTIYHLYNLKIPFAKFLCAFVANGLGFPLRILALKYSYPSLNINFKSIKKTALIEIIKSAVGDGITLFLIYNFKYSPIK